MPKDYTDFIVLIFDSGDRVYHMTHFWHGHGVELDHKIYPFKGHKYVLELDRAYRVRWAPWSKIITTKWKVEREKKGVKTTTFKVRYHPWRTLMEFVRSKKIGLLLYQEPPPPKTVETLVGCVCSCGYRGKTIAGTRVHAKAQGHEVKDIFKTEKVGLVREPIEPMHISRIHQPSGEMRG